MSNRLSFAQILQNKLPMDQSKNSYFSSSKIKQQRSQSSTNCIQQTPTLSQMMEEYIQYQEAPESNFVLSFVQKDLNMSNRSQDFAAGQNPLDSWIMTQSNLNTSKANHLSSTKKFNTSRNQNCSLIGTSKNFANKKQNRNKNYTNIEHLSKFSSRTYEKSMQNSQQIGESHKYGSTSPSIFNKSIKNVQMIGDTKIIQSQAYGYVQCENKKENFPKIERSEKMNNKIINVPIIPMRKSREEDGKKVSRYQNYEETDKKQKIEEVEKYLIGKKTNNHGSNENHPSKVIKRKSLEQEDQMTGIKDECLKDNEKKRIEVARQQISQYLKIKDVSIETCQTTNMSKFQFLKKTKISQQSIKQTKIESVHVHYSFAQNEESLIRNRDSFPHTNQQLQQINEHHQLQENERMLSCIQYTQSQADGEEPDNQIEHKKYENFTKLDVSQSIPEKQERFYHPQPSTLQRYLPIDHQYSQIDKHQSSATNQKFIDFKQKRSNLPQRLSQIQKSPSESIEEFSQIVEKVDVQPSIIENHSQKDEYSIDINNSDHPRFSEFSYGEIFQSIDVSKEVQPVFHDVSSLDIQISQQTSNPNIKIQSFEPEKHLSKPSTECIKVPKLNLKISDISSVSNQSNIESALSPIKCGSIPQSPKEHSNYKQISQVQSHQPVSSHESINLQAHVEGFMYAMRINSRNSSFTSDYNPNKHGQSNSFRSSHSSLHLKEEVSNLIEGNYSNVEDYNMNKNNRRFLQLELSKEDLSEQISQQVQDPEKEEESPLKQYHYDNQIKIDQVIKTGDQQLSSNEYFNSLPDEQPNYQLKSQLLTQPCNDQIKTNFQQSLESKESIAVQVIKNINDGFKQTKQAIEYETKQEIRQTSPVELIVCANPAEQLIESVIPQQINVIHQQPIIIITEQVKTGAVDEIVEVSQHTIAIIQTQIVSQIILAETIIQQSQIEINIIEPQFQEQIDSALTIENEKGLFEPNWTLPDIGLEAPNENNCMKNDNNCDHFKSPEMQVIKIQQLPQKDFVQPVLQSELQKQQQQLKVHDLEVQNISTQQFLKASMCNKQSIQIRKSCCKREQSFQFDLDF